MSQAMQQVDAADLASVKLPATWSVMVRARIDGDGNDKLIQPAGIIIRADGQDLVVRTAAGALKGRFLGVLGHATEHSVMASYADEVLQLWVDGGELGSVSIKASAALADKLSGGDLEVTKLTVWPEAATEEQAADLGQWAELMQPERERAITEALPD